MGQNLSIFFKLFAQIFIVVNGQALNNLVTLNEILPKSKTFDKGECKDKNIFIVLDAMTETRLY